mgnify:FL=1
MEYKLYVVSDEGKSTIALTAGSKEESGSSSTSSAGEFLRFKTTGSDSRTYEFRGGDSQKNSLCKKWSLSVWKMDRTEIGDRHRNKDL